MVQTTSNPFKIEIKLAPKAQQGVPAWVPPAGYFADVPMTNMPNDVTPAIYAGDSWAMRGPFDIWGGSAILRDFSPLGAQVYYSGGHENSAAQVQVGFTLVCDFSSLTWSVRNVPSKANPTNTFSTEGLAPDGQAYCFHTYQGLQEFPASWGGGPQGTLLAFLRDTASGKVVTQCDVSKAVLGYSTMATRQTQNELVDRIRFSAHSAGGTRVSSVMDEVRQGWWLACDMTVDYTLFLHRSGQVTQYPALGGNSQDSAIVLVPSGNILMVLDGGYDETNVDYGGKSYRRMYMQDLTKPWTDSHVVNTTIGVVPTGSQGYDSAGAATAYHAPGLMGLQWVEELGCIVGIDTQLSPPKIWKLTPTDAKNMMGAPWQWSEAVLKHWPSDANGQIGLQPVVNNAWSKFRWVPSLHAFVYGSAADRKPQVIKLG